MFDIRESFMHEATHGDVSPVRPAGRRPECLPICLVLSMITLVYHVDIHERKHPLLRVQYS